MRTVALMVLLVAGCTATPVTAPTSAPTASPAPTSPAATSSPEVTASPTPAPATVYTADDERIATIIQGAAAEAIPQLKVLNKMDPSKLEALFLPLDAWITAQRTAVETLTPSGCTATAVAAFNDAIDKYETIRKTFLGWRDWGANGRPFPVAAPGQAVKSFETALGELAAHCPPPD
jgi:hypothetical protein